MHKILLLTAFTLFSNRILVAQSFFSDTIGYYHNGSIEGDSTSLEKLYLGKTMLLQEFFEDGNLRKEFIRYSDSLYLFTEYYNLPDSVEFYSDGIKRQGLVLISRQTTGDTMLVFSPDTYEEFMHMDTLILPLGKWQFYYENGKPRMKGAYNDNGKIGKWEYYNTWGGLENIISFVGDKMINDTFINVILEKHLGRTEEILCGIWIQHDQESKGIKRDTSTKNKFMYRIKEAEGIGEIFTFEAGGRFNHLVTKIVNTEYEKREGYTAIIQTYGTLSDKDGTWLLKNFDQLELQMRDEIIRFQIEYLNEKHLELKRLN